MKKLSFLPFLAVLFVFGISAITPGGRGRAQGAAISGLSSQAVAQLQALLADKRTRTPAQRKIDSQLLYESRIARGQAIAAGIAAIETGVRTEPDGRVVVHVRAAVSNALLTQIQSLGADVIAVHPGYDDIRIQARFDQLETIAALPEVRYIAPRTEAITNRHREGSPTRGVAELKLGAAYELGGTSALEATRRQRRLARDAMVGRLRQIMTERTTQGAVPNVGSRRSQGDRTHEAGEARGTWGLTGAGVKIGVLSDGIDGLAASQTSGDLPAVTVLPGQGGSGSEGTAMLEIIHDLAPGAQLFFATAFNGVPSFAQNILDLRNLHGCDIIVDDVFYVVETPFQDGQTYTSPTNGAIVIQAVKDVAAAGALYFSSAGNSGNKNDGTSGTWEGDFVDGGVVGFPEAGHIHQFTTGQNYNVMNESGFRNVLFWSDPLGGSGND